MLCSAVVDAYWDGWKPILKVRFIPMNGTMSRVESNEIHEIQPMVQHFPVRHQVKERIARRRQGVGSPRYQWMKFYMLYLMIVTGHSLEELTPQQ